MSINFRALLTIACLAVASVALPLHATMIQSFTTLTALEAAATLQTITFDGTVPSGGNSGTTYSNSSGYTINTVNFTGVENSTIYSLMDYDTSTIGAFWFYNFGSDDALFLNTQLAGGATLPHFHITLPTGVTAFGVNLASISPYGLSYNVVVNGVGTTALTSGGNPTMSTPGTPGFFGATFDTAVTSIDIYPLGYIAANPTTALLDNFSFGTADAPDPPATAEGSTLLLIGSGLVVLAGGRKLRKRSPALTA